MAEENIIVAKGLTKVFDGVTAVDGVSLEIKEGEVFGLLGPNGAGKTTLLSMLSTVLLPTVGTAKVNDLDVYLDRKELRATIGIVFQEHSLDPKATGRENLEMAAAFYGIDRGNRRKRIDELLRVTGLGERADTPVRTYSAGMKRSIEIVRALLHKPKLLFLDEPTLGLDPQARESIWGLITNLEGVTILLATNYMEEAERLCGRLGIIDRGKIVAVDTPDGLKASLQGSMISLKIEEPGEALEILRKFDFVKEANVIGGRIVLRVENWDQALLSIARLSEKEKIESIEVYKPTLNDVFLRYTGRRIKEE